MGEQKSLDLSQINQLLKDDDKQEEKKLLAKTKRGVYPTEPRSYDTWFRLQTHFGKCSNPNCVDPRDNIVGKTMVAMVNESEICRYCFLDGVNRIVK